MAYPYLSPVDPNALNVIDLSTLFDTSACYTNERPYVPFGISVDQQGWVTIREWNPYCSSNNQSQNFLNSITGERFQAYSICETQIDARKLNHEMRFRPDTGTGEFVFGLITDSTYKPNFTAIPTEGAYALWVNSVLSFYNSKGLGGLKERIYQPTLDNAKQANLAKDQILKALEFSLTNRNAVYLDLSDGDPDHPVYSALVFATPDGRIAQLTSSGISIQMKSAFGLINPWYYDPAAPYFEIKSDEAFFESAIQSWNDPTTQPVSVLPNEDQIRDDLRLSLISQKASVTQLIVDSDSTLKTIMFATSSGQVGFVIYVDSNQPTIWLPEPNDWHFVLDDSDLIEQIRSYNVGI